MSTLKIPQCNCNGLILSANDFRQVTEVVNWRLSWKCDIHVALNGPNRWYFGGNFWGEIVFHHVFTKWCFFLCQKYFFFAFGDNGDQQHYFIILKLHYCSQEADIHLFLTKLRHLLLLNPHKHSGLFHPHILDDSISNLRGVWSTFSYLF